MIHTKPSIAFNDLPDIAMIQVGPLINFKVLPYSATTIWRKCRTGEFPAPIKMSSGITAWKVGDIRKYLEAIGNPTKEQAK
jgi:prophage regulatory protein